jgi:hypothetical protein
MSSYLIDTILWAMDWFLAIAAVTVVLPITFDFPLGMAIGVVEVCTF